MRRTLTLLFLTLTAAAQQPLTGPLADARRALAQKDFARARQLYAAYSQQHPSDINGQLGLADTELALHEYAAAETLYRRIVSAQPLLWGAHKNLVITEAALGHWEDFDNERAYLRAARQRHAAGLDPHESDVIDTISLNGQRWIVRDYFEPSGRTRARYNFEHFDTNGRALAYVSLESADAFAAVAPGGAVAIGPTSSVTEMHGFALNLYTGNSHSTLRTYATEPSYERLRTDFLHWLRNYHHP